MNLLFRQMELLDLDDVKSLDKLAFPNPWPDNAFRYEFEQNTNARLWVGELEQAEEKVIIAFAVIWIIVDEAHIGTFAVHPQFQQHGIGTKFLVYVFQQLINENINRIFLEVRKSNEAAIHLYQKFGFAIDGERKNYYRDNRETAILMSAPIFDEDYYINLIQENQSPYEYSTRR